MTVDQHPGQYLAYTPANAGTGNIVADYAAVPLPGSGREPGRRDEMLDPSRQLRAPWRGVGEVLVELGSGGLTERRAAIDRLLQDDGVSYRPWNATQDQSWTLDPVPLLIDEAEWAALEPALVQRAELMDAILTDLYGPRRLIADGLLPPAVVFGHRGFLRDADGIRLPGPHQLFLSAADLARGADGTWQVVGDRAQAPSGAGYAMENRSVLSRALPGLYRGTAVHRIAPFFHTLRHCLQRIAPRPADAPRVVLLSPGAGSETAFDQAFMSSLLGLPLTTGADLTVRDGRVWQRSLSRLEPVDVILRRVDDDYCDPLDLRGDSRLGVPGLVEAARAGTVSIVNGIGSGVLENPGLFPYLDAVARALLGEPLLMPSVQTWWCGDPIARQHVLAHLDQLVLKPLSRTFGRNSRAGWELSSAERDELAARIAAEPDAWVGQEPLAMSTAPTLRHGVLEPRPVVLRTFAVASGESYQLMPGGLTRAAAEADTVIVANASGAVSKDVWVLSTSTPSGDESQLPGLIGPETVSAAVSPRVAEDLFWLGRYAERAESVARLLRVVDNRWRDRHPTPDPALAQCLTVLLEAVTAITTTWPGFVGDGAAERLASPRTEVLALVTDEDRIGTLAHDLARVRSLANAVRDQLSADTWTVLSGLDRSVRGFGRASSADEFTDGLARLLQGTLAFSGLVGESMVRDTGWYFLDAGRRLERALQITGLLRECLVRTANARTQALVIESVLIAAESIITHRRRYPARADVDTVLELLLCDRNNPRALMFSLAQVEIDLAETSATGDAVDEARRLTAEIMARVQASDPVALADSVGAQRPALAAFLDQIRWDLQALYRLVESTHFTQLAPMRPLEPFSTGDPA